MLSSEESEYRRGMAARENGKPLDSKESELWIAGWKAMDLSLSLEEEMFYDEDDE